MGLPNLNKFMTQKNQSSIQIKNGIVQERNQNLQNNKDKITKEREIQNARNAYAKEQQEVLRNKINNLNMKRQGIQKNLGRNVSDMTPQQIAENKQKITDINLKIQSTREDTRQKIMNYKKSKQF